MKTIYSIILIIVSALLFSCQKEVIIDLNSVNKIPVVQANVTNQPGPYTVQLNNTANYYEANNFTAIVGASVVVTDNSGNSQIFQEVAPGFYQSPAFTGTPGITYHLSVTTNGKEYTASSTMPLVVPIDSVVIENTTNNDGKRVICYFKDPPVIGNYYRLRLASNDTANINQNSIRIATDNLTNGNEMRMSFRTDLHADDTVTVKLESIDKTTYDFYNTLSNAEGDENQFMSALPANPTNNISNGGLGYFSAYAVAEKTAVIK